MKKFMQELKAVFNDPTNRGILRILKWIVVILEVGAIGGFAGLVLAAITICCWTIPKE